jgi:peptidoglycan hydrolase-like protein with peptidoglycan-binding domain
MTPELIQGIQNGSLGVNDLAAIGAEQVDVSKQGERSRVETLQQNLNRLGYVDAAGCELKVDGDYGRRTRLAVEEFQRRNGLVADGIAGPLTLAAVERAVEKEFRSIGQHDASYLRWEEPSEALSAYRSLAPEPRVMRAMPIFSAQDQARSGDLSVRDSQVYPSGAHSRRADGPDQLGRDGIGASPSTKAPDVRCFDQQDPRNPKSILHELYGELGRRVPDASEDRLLQFTAACHENGITAQNLVESRLDEQRGTLTFIGTGPLALPARIDLTSPPPYPEEAIQQIQRNDLQQQQMMEQVRIQQAQMGMGFSR